MVGVVASRIPPEKLSAGGYKRYTDCYIDIGLHSKEEVLKYVDVGDVACYEGPYTELAPGYITAKAIDDRVGCYMLLAAIMNVKKPKNDVYLAFTVQEEVGTRGGQVTAQRIQPGHRRRGGRPTRRSMPMGGWRGRVCFPRPTIIRETMIMQPATIGNRLPFLP